MAPLMHKLIRLRQVISLNRLLHQTDCIEYVIVHELCHLIHRNHTAKFMDLQNKEMHG